MPWCCNLPVIPMYASTMVFVRVTKHLRLQVQVLKDFTVPGKQYKDVIQKTWTVDRRGAGKQNKQGQARCKQKRKQQNEVKTRETNNGPTVWRGLVRETRHIFFAMSE